MKVLYVSHTSLVSGAEGALLDLLARLPSGIAPVLACPSGSLAMRASAMGIRVVPIRPVSGSFRLGLRQTTTAMLQIGRTAAALRRILDAERPDLVHANGLRASLVARAALVGRDTPLLAHCHDALPANVQGVAVGLVLRGAAAVVAVSQYTASTLAKTATQRRISVLYNPLDTSRFDPDRITRAAARAELGIAEDAELIGVIGQITPWKGHETAIRALHALGDSHPRARLVIVGEPKFTSPSGRFDNRGFDRDLKRLAWDLGIADRVEFWGERTDVAVLIRAMDVCLTPSWQEPFGRTLIEAMALETAVVATNVGGPPEYVSDGVTGLLAPPNNVWAWAESIRRLLDNSDERTEIARRASSSVRVRFNSAVYAQRVVDLYEQLAPQRDAGDSRRGPDVPPVRARPDRVLAKRRLRVLFVEHSSTTSGAQHSLFELMRVLEVDNEIILACPSGELAERMSARGFSVVHIPDSQLSFHITATTTPREVARTLRARAAVVRQIRSLRPDIVHANSIRAGLLTAFHRTNSAVVVHCRDLLPRGRAGRMVGNFVLGRAAVVVAVSRAAAERLAAPRESPEKVIVIDNPVDASRFDPRLVTHDEARRRLGLNGGPILGLVAQITPWKGHTRAVRVLERVRTEHPDAKLVIAGAAKFVTPGTRYDNVAYEGELRQLVSDLALGDAVVFLGDTEDIPEVLAALDVLLAPSTEEPFGRTIIEALAMGVPVVATDAGGPPDIIRWGLDGYVVPPDETQAWADAVCLLVGRGHRDELRRYATARFDPVTHADAVLSTYRRLTDVNPDRAVVV